MCPRCIIADQVVQDSHIAIDSFEELLLCLLKFGFNRCFFSKEFLLDELLSLFLDLRGQCLKFLHLRACLFGKLLDIAGHLILLNFLGIDHSA